MLAIASNGAQCERMLARAQCARTVQTDHLRQSLPKKLRDQPLSSSAASWACASAGCTSQNDSVATQNSVCTFPHQLQLRSWRCCASVDQTLFDHGAELQEADRFVWPELLLIHDLTRKTATPYHFVAIHRDADDTWLTLAYHHVWVCARAVLEEVLATTLALKKVLASAYSKASPVVEENRTAIVD